jgi:hypothetical protein
VDAAVIVGAVLAAVASVILAHRFHRLVRQRHNPWRGPLVTPKSSVARRRMPR